MRAIRIIEKLAFSRYLDTYKNLYILMNNKSIISAIIYHNPKKDNFILTTLKSTSKYSSNKINGNAPKYISKGDSISINRLYFMGLIDINHPLKKPITDPKEIASFINKGAARLGLIKKHYGILNKEEFITAMTVKEGISIGVIKNLIPTVEFTPSGYKFHDITIIGNKQKDIDNIKDILTDVYNLYKSINMEKKLMYGEFYLTNALSKDLLADYSISTDSIRITNKARKSKNSIRTIIHELAHRWYYKLNDNQKKEIKEKYNDMMSHIANSKTLAIGDRYNHPKYGEIEIESKNWNKRTYEAYYVFRVLKDNSRYRIKDAGDLRHAKKISGEADIFNLFDVSNYGRTQVTEFWPEVVAIALTDNNKELIKWIKGFTK